jgi:hypothetical protein
MKIPQTFKMLYLYIGTGERFINTALEFDDYGRDGTRVDGPV